MLHDDIWWEPRFGHPAICKPISEWADDDLKLLSEEFGSKGVVHLVKNFDWAAAARRVAADVSIRAPHIRDGGTPVIFFCADSYGPK